MAMAYDSNSDTLFLFPEDPYHSIYVFEGIHLIKFWKDSEIANIGELLVPMLTVFADILVLNSLAINNHLYLTSTNNFIYIYSYSFPPPSSSSSSSEEAWHYFFQQNHYMFTIIFGCSFVLMNGFIIGAILLHRKHKRAFANEYKLIQ